MTSPVPPPLPGSLDQTEQQHLIQQIGRALVGALPPRWHEAQLEYRALGAHVEMVARLVTPNGTAIPLTAPAEASDLLARLRHGMYQPERGTWASALYRLQRPGSYSVDFNGEVEPAWSNPPAPADYAEEMRRYPRTPENTPPWLAVPHDATGTAAAELRTAEVYSGEDGSGQPVRHPQSVAGEEQDRVLEYLERAPIVLAARSYDTDRLDPQRAPSVPLTFHTDGRWIWPGAAAYYLRAHGVAPEPDLVAHIRQSGFALPEVDDSTRERAVAVITGEQR